MATVTFDSTNLLIIVDTEGGATSTLTAGVLYGDWKEWVLLGNAGIPPAFSNSVGGQTTVAPNKVGSYYFVRNDLGWRIRPDERDHELILDGNVFGADPALSIWAATVGAYNVQTRLNLSSLTLVADMVTMQADTALARKLLDNRHVLSDGVASNEVIYDDDDVTVLRTYDVTDESDLAISLGAGDPAKRSKGV